MVFNEKVKQLSAIVDEQLLPVINKNTKVKECVYLDLPYHTNIGDTLIWLGTEYFLNRTGLKCLYSASLVTHNDQKMKKIVKTRKKILIFLHGGGNFGDLWEYFQEFRRRIISKFPDNQIIILPQTVFYNNKSKMEADAELFAKHKDLTICARCKKSYQILKENFQNNVILTPDMAFCIPQKELFKYTISEISDSTLLLKRSDKEIDKSVDYSRYIPQKQFDTHDWVTREKHLIEKRFLEVQVVDRLLYSKKVPKIIADWFAKKVFQKIMIRSGVKQLSKYENIYSTRLHTAILSLLLEKPVVLFDNSYGKNSSFFETWLSDADGVKFINTKQLPS